MPPRPPRRVHWCSERLVQQAALALWRKEGGRQGGRREEGGREGEGGRMEEVGMRYFLTHYYRIRNGTQGSLVGSEGCV